MKKFSLCIGAFLVLFLMFGGYTAQAQGDLQEFNATWLKFSGKATGSELAGGEGSTSPAQKDNGSIQLYGCVVGFPEGPALIQVYEKDSTANRAGWGTFSKKGGTADKFIGWFHLRTSDEGWSAVNPNDYTTDTYVPGEMTAKNEKLNFKGYGGQAEKKPATGYDGYALYGVKLGAKTATARSLPFDETTPCPWPSGVYRIQVINPDGATVDPAGPYVEVASGATQAFTVTPPPDYTCTVSLDGAAPSAGPWEFTNVTANHSISVACVLADN